MPARTASSTARSWVISASRSSRPRVPGRSSATMRLCNHCGCCGARRSADLHPADRARDHEPLDLRGALEDRVDLRVAVHALDGILARVAVAAEDLDRTLRGPDGHLARLQLRHRALGVVEGLAGAAHPRGAPHEQPRGVDLELHVRERERDRLVLDDRPAELRALLGVVERVLVRRACDAERLRAPRRAARLEGLHGGLALRALALARLRHALVKLLLPAEQAAAGDAAVVEEDVGGVRGAQAVLLDLGAHLHALGARWDDEGGLAAGLQLGIDRRDHDVHVRDAAVRRPRLLSVQDPLVLGLVVLRARAQRGDVGAGVRLAHAERADLRLLLGPEALRDPLAHLLGRARAEDARHRERRTHDRHADAGVAPEELLVHDREREAGLVGPELGDRLEAVEPDLRRLLDHRPGRLLLLVPLCGSRPNDPVGEPVDPVADVLLVLVQRHREVLLGRLAVGGDLGFGRPCGGVGGGGGFHRGKAPSRGPVMVLNARSVIAMQGAYQREGGSRPARNRSLHDASRRRSWVMRDDTGVTEVEPELGAIEAYDARPDEPLFPLVLRGYDRHMVEEHVELLTGRLAELEAMQSPSVAVQEALERVAADTGSILKEAHETADGVLSRARAEAERMLREARDEADRTIASAEARVRQLGIDTDSLWQERMRLIDDSRAVASSLTEIADAAADRFPPEAIEEEDEASIVEQPTEAFDVAEMLAAEDADAAADPDEHPLPDGLEDLEPPPEFGR